jgi:hypothetical protein
MPRFVLLEHDHPHRHWDLMLEVGAVLWSWRLDRPPEAGARAAATRTADHRTLYLDYEGPVSGGRGTVRRHDQGTFDWLEQDAEQMRVRVAGKHLCGQLLIRRIRGEQWQVDYLVNVTGIEPES